MVACTGTARPSFIPGRNRHFSTASMAFWSKPSPSGRMTLRSRGFPLSSTMTARTTVPWNFALRASSEYSGSTLKITVGAETITRAASGSDTATRAAPHAAAPARAVRRNARPRQRIANLIHVELGNVGVRLNAQRGVHHQLGMLVPRDHGRHELLHGEL